MKRAGTPSAACGASASGRRAPLAEATAWLGVVDIDHFKRVNDTYGHLIGDEVLLLMSRLLRSSFRHHDRLYRFGGEEFVIVLPETALHEGEQVAEKLRQELAAVPFNSAGGDVIVTASFGVATLTLASQDSSDPLLKRADRALYQSKRDGRNRVTVSAEPFHADLTA